MVTTIPAMRDEPFMDQALVLARRAHGATSPNPMVGAILVNPGGDVVGTGYHERAGMPHAEICALEAAGTRARGATLYCTLEPCAHQGRTGPCAPRIVDAGVRRVVVGTIDPNPRVRGAGIAHLEAHGVEVRVGVRRTEALRLNETFVTWITKGRPFVTMKIALSLDGCVADRPGRATRLTSAAATEAVHCTRSEVDAIAVGSGTVLADDPRLTARGQTRVRPLTRVVFDRRLRTPPTAAIFSTLAAGPIVIVTTSRTVDADPARADALRRVGAQLELLERESIADAFGRLAELEVTSVLLEGGPTLHRAAWRARLVDRVQQFVTPRTLGATGVPWIGADVSLGALRDLTVTAYGPDVLLDGYVQRVD